MKTIHGMPMPEAILHMAIETFVELGYAKASMDEVAARASTTKRTVYAYFGSKDDLFRAALAKAVQLFHAELPRLEDADHPARQLEDFAVAFGDHCSWRGAVRLQQVVMGEMDRFSDLGVMLHRDIIEWAEAMVADYLRSVDCAQQTRPENWHTEISRLFLNMSTGYQRFATLLQARQPAAEHPQAKAPPEFERERIRLAVGIILRGTGLATPDARG
jgi:AcrR family transcriptional regulator